MNSKKEIEWEKKLEKREFKYDEACRNAQTKEEKIKALIPFIEQRVIFRHWATSDLSDVLICTFRRIHRCNLSLEFYPLVFEILDRINLYDFPRLEIYKGSFNDGMPTFKAKEEHRRIFKDGHELFEDDKVTA